MSKTAILIAALFCLAPCSSYADDWFADCRAENGKRIKPDYIEERSTPWLAKGDIENAEIRVNMHSPYNIVSLDTLMWLFYRECYFVREGIADDERQEPKAAKRADCWALNYLTKIGYDPVPIDIERDLETLEATSERAWTSVFGPWRRVRFKQCELSPGE